MNLQIIGRLLRRKWIWLLLFPAISAATVVYLTRDMEREYVTNAIIYTGLASGYSITSSEESRVDNYAINNAFDNLLTTIKSGETVEEVAMRLLAGHLILTKPDPYKLNPKGFAVLAELMNERSRKALVVPGNEGATYERIRKVVKEPANNLVKKILYDSKSTYAIDGIVSRLTASRKNTSDMLELSFKADDPAVCQRTLAILIDVFRARYTHVKSSEIDNVVRYFENKVAYSYKRLRGTENTLKNFGVNNKIINYNEQTMFIAESKEHTATEYSQEIMNFRAAKAAFETLEKRLSTRLVVVATNEDILARRTELAKVQLQLANAMISGQSLAIIEPLQTKFQQLSDQLRDVARTFYNNTNTAEGLPQGDVLDNWLAKLLQYEESKARITVMEKRLKEYDAIYSEFAPLGSTLNQMEREVGVAEKEYLVVLHGLNQARLRQKNLEMSGSLTVLDVPKFPLAPQPSKRIVLVLASFMAGFVVVFAFFLTRELLIKGLRTPEQAEAKIGLPLAAAFPLASSRNGPYSVLHLEENMLEQLRSVILVETLSAAPQNSYCLVILFSTRPGGRATWVGEHISNQLAKAGHQVAYLFPAQSADETYTPNTAAYWGAYPVETDFADTKRIETLLEQAEITNDTGYSFVFLELPVLREVAVPVYLVAQANLSLLVVNALTGWARVDTVLCDLYRKASRGRVMMVVDQVEPDLLEPLLGPIERRKKERPKKTESAPVSPLPTSVS